MNQHIVENLNHYIALEKPEYAVLLSGKWGSGKTYFINKFVEDFLEKYKVGSEENKTKFIKISLFGLSKVTQIDEEIFQMLHPVLGHKYAKMAGSMLKSAFKLGLNFDTDGDGKPDGKLSVDPKEFSFFSDNKKSKKELIFIFDDLERTNIELSEILGYINYLVEQSKFKVIIIANEEEIKNKDKFLQFKEKVIGKTFEVKQDLDAIFSTFIDITTDSREVLTKHKQLIKDIFKIGNYNNLRHVRQTVLDFEYFYNQLDNKYKTQDEIIHNLLYEFFAFSIEIKSGKLNSNNFKSRYDDILKNDDASFNEEKTEFDRILEKYSIGEFNLTLSSNIWKDILLKGTINPTEVKKELDNSKYLMDEKTESWRRLWDYRDLEDEEFKRYLEEVDKKFYNNEYEEQGKLLHVISLLLYFSKSNMYLKNQSEIKKKAKENIQKCIMNKKWDSIEYDNHFGGSAYSLGFFERDSNSMQEILKYFKKEIDKSFSNQLNDKAKKLLKDFQNNDLSKLETKLLSEFYSIPIFNYMDRAEFVSMIQQLRHRNIYKIVQIIKKRYNNRRAYDFEDILSEEKFWKSIKNRILRGINPNELPVKYNLLKSFKKYIFVDILENFKESREFLEKT